MPEPLRRHLAAHAVDTAFERGWSNLQNGALLDRAEADLRRTVTWAEKHKQRWAFTSSNAGSNFFEDYSDLAQLDEIDWNAVRATDWGQCKEGKQAEFLVEHSFPWELVSRIGVRTRQVYHRAIETLAAAAYTPPVEISRRWYY